MQYPRAARARRLNQFFLILAAMMWMLAGSAGAQTSATASLDRYKAAVTQPTIAGRIAALKAFVAADPTSSLHKDALTALTWDYQQTGNAADALRSAQELQGLDAGNPVAVAVKAEAARKRMASPVPVADGVVALQRLAKFDPPEGMAIADFSGLRTFAYGRLVAAVGEGYLQQKAYVTAREWLRRAAQQFPEDPQYAYDVALADLSGKDPNAAEGYWYLAKTVELTRGSAAGKQIADYARREYEQAGGSSGAWDQFLIAAGGTTGAGGQRTSGAATAVAKTVGASPAVQTAELKTTLPPLPKPERKIVAPGAPVSIGVLLQTSLMATADRRAVLHGLDDFSHHLRDYDEEFMLSFDRGMVFDQDLTANRTLLENAAREIKPHSGTALLDAVTFAAGHLGRIAKNNKRVLLVISDGENANSHESPLDFSAAVHKSGVTIYCIGVGVMERAAQYRLQEMASATGGQALFVAGAPQLQEATDTIVSRLGLP